MGSFTAWATQHPYLSTLAGIGVGTVLGVIIILAFIGVAFFSKQRMIDRHEKELRRGQGYFQEIRTELAALEGSVHSLENRVQTQQNVIRQLTNRQVDTIRSALDAAKKPRQRRPKKERPSQWDIVAKDEEDAGPQG